MNRTRQTTRRLIATAVLAVGWLGLGGGAQAAYPDKPIHIIVPFAAGSSTDLNARELAPMLAKFLGQQVVVDNRAGASAIVGTQQASKAPADGYTLFAGNSTSLGLNPSSFKTLPYDPAHDFTSIGFMAFYPLAVVVSKKLGVHSVADLVTYAKAHPSMKYASSGVGTVPHLMGAQFAKEIGVPIGHVPYNEMSQAFTDMIGGLTGMLFYPYLPVKPQIDSGAIEAIATTGSIRSPWLANLPTMAEAGYPDLTVQAWSGLFVQRGTPADVLAALTNATQRINTDPDFRKNAGSTGMVISDMTAAQTDKFTVDEIAHYHVLAEAADIKQQ